MMAERDGNNVFVVKNWHVVLTVLLWLITAVISYTNLNAQSADTARRVRDLEEQHFIPGSQGVTKDQFNEFRDDLFRRLDNWERERDIQRNLHPAAH